MYEYRTIESEYDLDEKLNELAQNGWRAIGLAVRSTSMRDYKIALLERKIKE